MAKVSYVGLKLKVNTEVKTFNWEDKEIEVLQYLPISDKYDLIMVALQKAKEGEIYNPIKLDMYFHLNLVYLYTNLYFTDKQKEDEEKIFDALVSSGLLAKIMENMAEDEFQDLWDKMTEYMNSELKYTTTAAALIKSIIADLPTQAQAAMDIVNNFDPDKFAAVRDFANAANGNRDISTNQPIEE